MSPPLCVEWGDLLNSLMQAGLWWVVGRSTVLYNRSHGIADAMPGTVRCKRLWQTASLDYRQQARADDGNRAT